ncbi:MAG: ROK family protein, partial [Streptosporangiaceae bacterium]
MFSGLSLAGIDRRAGHAAIGIDVGGTKVALGLLDAAELSLLDSVVIPTGRDRGGQAVLADIRASAADLAGRAAARGRRVSGIGLVVPEIVSLAGDIVSGAVIPQWNELPVAEALSEIAPVRVEADVRAAAFAETVLGAGQGYDYLVFVTVGTGISYTAVYQGRPIAGSRGGALNVGTTVLARLPEHCAGPGTGPHGEPRELVLERISSGSALVERYVARGGRAEGAGDVLAAA